MIPETLKPGDRAFNMTVDLATASKNLIVQRGCFAIMFTNRGDAIANVNGLVINPSPTPLTVLGDSRSISGHQNNLFYGSAVLTIAPGTAAPLVEIVQLFYMDYQ